jgi:dipeptide transport system permease protein
LLVRLVPGDPVLLMLGERGASPAVYQEMRRNLGLDRPLVEQYGRFLLHAVQGDLGRSLITNKPITEEFWGRFPATVELGVTGMLFAILIGIPLGIIAALWRGKLWDYLLMGGALVGYSMPIFWWGLILIIVFSVGLGWTPVSGRVSDLLDIAPWSGFLLVDTLVRGDLQGFSSAVSHLILPAVALGTVPLAAIARMTRSSLLEVLREDYIRTAHAKGLPLRKVVIGHALSNAMIPIVTVIGLMFGSILTGAILTETIFSWPGVGKWIVASVQARDYPALQGGILILSVAVMTVNICVDTTYQWLNPALRDAGD